MKKQTDNGIRLLIIEPSNWSQFCGRWIAERGYRVEVENQIPANGYHAYDLILLDETLWLTNPSAEKLLAKKGEHLIIISSDYSPEGYLQATQAGASGYIDKQLDQDTFIQELEKFSRKVGLLPRRRRVLLVDNDPHVLEALKDNLKKEGYTVETAKTAAETMRKIPLFRPHVAVVDIKLQDDDDPLDRSGFTLSKEIKYRFGHAVKIVGLTGIPERNMVEDAVGIFSRFVLKDAKSVSKVDNLGEAIELAFDKLKINTSLEIEFETDLSLKELVNTMKAYRDLTASQQRLAADELEELLRKLFRRELQVKAYYLSPGRGGSGVVLMRPIIDGTPAEYSVVKFGLRENIAIELEKYNRYVQPFIGRRATQLIDIADKPMETLNLGGLKFSFTGMTKDNPRDFNSFYRDPATTTEQICGALQDLFYEACVKWYDAKRPWSDTRPDGLVRAYEDQLALTKESNKKELAMAMSRLLDDQSTREVSFALHPPYHIKVSLADRAVVYPHPFPFIEQRRRHFPPPQFECRTHGDLNGRNMFVDKEARVWLIDFFKTDWGPVLRDFGELETVIKFELLETTDLTVLYLFEQALLTPTALDAPIILPPTLNQIDEIKKATVVITQLRQIAQDKFGATDIHEYYLGLLFYAIKMLTWEGISSIERGRYPTRQRHALLSASILCHRLEQDAWLQP